MRVAIITPYHDETEQILRRCHDSVVNQTYGDVTHIMIGDGADDQQLQGLKLEHYRLPVAHRDAGATPRAIGAISAFSRGYDAIGFLDADNYLKNNHVQMMVDILGQSGADGIVATRVIHSRDDQEMYVDRIESNGENMVDTNSWFLTSKSLPSMTGWIVNQKHRLWSDRYFAKAISDAGLRLARCEIPTVVYCTRWAWHYQHAGWPIPDGAVWINQNPDGTLNHVVHSINT